MELPAEGDLRGGQKVAHLPSLVPPLIAIPFSSFHSWAGFIHMHICLQFTRGPLRLVVGMLFILPYLEICPVRKEKRKTTWELSLVIPFSLRISKNRFSFCFVLYQKWKVRNWYQNFNELFYYFKKLRKKLGFMFFNEMIKGDRSKYKLIN